MTVATQHEHYTAMLSKWTRCRDAASGQAAIHNAAVTYLPKLSDQTQAEYDAYKLRTGFYNATWRTISGLRGMLFRKPAIVQVAPVAMEMLEDVTLGGESLHMFAQEVAEECLTVGRIGIFVDYSNG